MIDYGHGVKLDRICGSDLDQLRRWRNNEAIRRWCRQSDLIDELTQEDWYQRQSEDASISMYKIIHDARTVGVCGLTSIDHLHGRAEFSLYIAPEHQGKGFARGALKTLFTHGFKSLALNLIWGETFEGNGALKLFESLGMQREGLRRQFYWKEGKFIDCHLVSVLASEWTGKNDIP